MYHQPTVRVLFVSAGGPELLRPLDTLAGAFAELGHAVEFAGPPDTPTDAGAGSWTAVGWPAEQARQQYLRNHPDLASLDRNERGAFSMAHLFGGVMAPASAADLIRLVADGGFELVAHDPCALAAPLAARLAGVRSVCCGPVLPTEWTAAASDAVAPLWRTWGLEPEPHAGLYAHPYVDIRPRLLRNGVEAPGVTIPMRCTPEPQRGGGHHNPGRSLSLEARRVHVTWNASRPRLPTQDRRGQSLRGFFHALIRPPHRPGCPPQARLLPAP